MLTVVILEEEARVAHALARELRHLGARTVIVEEVAALRAAMELEVPHLLIADLWTSERQGGPALVMAKECFPQVRRCLLSGSIHQLDGALLDSIAPCVVLGKPWRSEDVARLVEPVVGAGPELRRRLRP